MNLLRYFCEEVEADLLERGIDIHDWWTRARGSDGRLKLSSRRLLIFAMRLPECSAFKDEWRQDWPSDMYVKAATLNEIRALRADMAVFNGREYQEPSYLKSPRQVESDEAADALRDSIREGIRKQLYSKLNKQE